MISWEIGEEVWRIGFIPAALALLVGLAWHALRISREVVRVPPVLGRHPSKDDPEALRRTILRLQDIRSSYRRGLLGNWFQLGLFGVFLPLVLFFLVCLHSTYVPNAGVFVLVGGVSSVVPTAPQALIYALDQISSALTLGLFEMWQWKPWRAIVVHDPQTPGVLPVLFLFRGIIDFFSGAWIFGGVLALWNGLIARNKIQERIKRHNEELLNAVRAQAIKTAGADQPTDLPVAA